MVYDYRYFYFKIINTINNKLYTKCTHIPRYPGYAYANFVVGSGT